MKHLDLLTAAERGRLPRLLERYLAECHAEQTGKKGARFPNLAGFCRWAGCGLSAVEALRAGNGDAADYLLAVLEDEALNSPVLSPTLTGAYLKRRLGYGEKSDAPASQTECGEMRLIFEHDIGEDGA